jgi:regulatory protein PHO2
MASQVSKHDLVAYICESRNSLIWFIHSSGYGFKMEIPFGIVVDTEFVSAAPGSALASFFLSQPPLFYLEDIVTDPAGGPPLRTWKRCADWTEGMQATKILRHDLVGSAVQLAYVLRNFQANPGSDIRLRCPPYVRPDLSSAQSMDHSSVALPPSLMNDPQGYRPPFGGGGLETGRDTLVTDAPKQRYNYPSIYVPLSAPSDTSTFGDNLGNSPRSHLTLPDNNSSDSSPPSAFSTFPLSAASSSSNYSTVSLYPIEVPVQRPQSHLGNYAHVSTSGQSPYIGQGQGFSIPAPPASAPPSHSQFELAQTPPQSSFVQQQQFPSHQSVQMFKPPAMPVPLPFGNGFDTSGQHGEL